MVNARAIARLGMLAVGLGIGLAVAATPDVAVADSSADWLNDLFGGAALPAPAVPDVNLAISIDGYSLVSEGTASAYSGSGDFAIAYGDGAYASAQGGTGDYALADGSGANAISGGLSADAGADNDTAIDVGTNAGPIEGSYAGNGDLSGLGGGTGSGDTAIDIGNNSSPVDGSFAGAGFGESGDGDTAIDVGNNTNGYNGEGSQAWAGNDNYASILGDNSQSSAEFGNNNIADIVGPNSYAFAGDGNNNVGSVLRPFGHRSAVTQPPASPVIST